MIDLAFNVLHRACYTKERLAKLYDRAYTPVEVLTNQHDAWQYVKLRDRLWIVNRTLTYQQQEELIAYCCSLGIRGFIASFSAKVPIESMCLEQRMDAVVNECCWMGLRDQVFSKILTLISGA